MSDPQPNIPVWLLPCSFLIGWRVESLSGFISMLLAQCLLEGDVSTCHCGAVGGISAPRWGERGGVGVSLPVITRRGHSSLSGIAVLSTHDRPAVDRGSLVMSPVSSIPLCVVTSQDSRL